MRTGAGIDSGRHILEPLEQAGSMLGEIPEPEIAVPGRSGRRDARGRARLGICLAASLALHALGLALIPLSGSGEPGSTASAVRVSLSVGPVSNLGGEGRAAPAPSVPPPVETARTNPDAPGSEESEARPAAPADTAPGASDAGSPELAAESEGIVAPPAAPASPKGSGSAGSLSASDRAAALLLARVEAALVYPETARRRGTEGVVGLRIFLDGSGALADLKISRSSGSALLDKAAREAVAACLPLPNPSGAPLSFELAIRFALNKAAAP